MFALSHLIFKLLFIGDYVDGYIVSPYLFMAPLMQMLFQIGNRGIAIISNCFNKALSNSLKSNHSLFKSRKINSIVTPEMSAATGSAIR